MRHVFDNFPYFFSLCFGPGEKPMFGYRSIRALKEPWARAAIIG
jgi:hypothetical protein